MDVQCERCSTEYEFDDALVSGRGTTVKCTNCGHKFKIRRGDGDFSEDFWNVTTGDGRTLVFTSLRELQRAIQTQLVERDDRLSRGGLPPKAIGQIPELVLFFDQRDAGRKSLEPPRSPRQTYDGPPPITRPPPPPGATSASLGPPRGRQVTRPEFPAPPAVLDSAENGPPISAVGRGKATLIGTGSLLPDGVMPTSVSDDERPATVPPPPTERESEPETTRFTGEFADASLPEDALETIPPAPPSEAAPTEVFVRGAALTPAPAQATASSPSPSPEVPRVVSMPPPLPTRRQTPPQTQAVQASKPPPLPDRARRPAVVVDEEEDEGKGEPSRDESDARDERPSSEEISAPASDAASPAPPVQRSLLAEIDSAGRRAPSLSNPDSYVPSSRRRRPVGGFAVASVVAAGMLVLGALWVKHNGITLGVKPASPAPVADSKVSGLLASGEKALTDGNLEQAKESFDKASVLAERDPRLLLDVARLAAARADIAWMKSRLLAPDAADETRMTRDMLNEFAASARKAADEALAVAPEDPASLRVKVDALRIAGDRDGARALVPKISASAAQPETAYVLAALDLSAPTPLWAPVIERLRAASSAEAGPGRARAALVYALARSGDADGAKAEVERLSAMSRAHPLLPLLRAFAERAKPPVVAGKGDAGAPVIGGHANEGGKGGGEKVSGALPGDPRELVRQADRARGKGDLERAKALYNAALEKNGNDSEALAGLANVAHAQRDLVGARASYKRVLSINPNYMPALVGLGDVDWESGDRAGAVKTYREITERYPEGTYPGRVKERIEAGGGG